MSFALQYKPLIESESSVSKTMISPRNIYKINSYKYIDGKTKSLGGIETSIVFVIGVTPTKMVSCLKISLVKPEKFLKWLKKLFKPNLDEDFIQNSESLEDIILLDNKDGQKIFNQFVRGSALYKQTPSTYRTYLLKNIKSIEELNIRKDILTNLIK